MRVVSLRHPVLASFLSEEFLFHIPCCHHFYAGSFSYTSDAGFIFMLGVSLKNPVMTLTRGSFSYTSHTTFIFIWGMSLTHPVLASFLSGESSSLTYFVLASFLSGGGGGGGGEGLFFISRVGFIFI